MKSLTDRQMDARVAFRAGNDMRAYERRSKREDAAYAMIGNLNSGKLYVYPVGGKYREGTRHELIDFLIRRGYA